MCRSPVVFTSPLTASTVASCDPKNTWTPHHNPDSLKPEPIFGTTKAVTPQHLPLIWGPDHSNSHIGDLYGLDLARMPRSNGEPELG